MSGSAAVVTFVGSRARSRSRAGTSLAVFLTLECDRLRAALRRFKQVDADSCFDALALDRPAAATATFPASKPESFEEVAENVKDVVDVLETASATSSTADTFMAKAVVASPFLFVAENVIRLGRFFETFDRGIVAGFRSG